MSWRERIGLTLWVIIGVMAAQTVFDAYDPAHCMIVCPEREKGAVVPGGQSSAPETPKAGNGEYAVRPAANSTSNR